MDIYIYIYIHVLCLFIFICLAYPTEFIDDAYGGSEINCTFEDVCSKENIKNPLLLEDCLKRTQTGFYYYI